MEMGQRISRSRVRPARSRFDGLSPRDLSAAVVPVRSFSFFRSFPVHFSSLIIRKRANCSGRAGGHVPADAHKAAVNTLAAAPEREGDRGGKEVTPRFVRHE